MLITGGISPAQDFKMSATRDGRPEILQITWSPEVHQSGPGVDLPALWPNRLSLLPQRHLEVAATLDRPLRPGRYEFQLETTLKDEDGRSVNPLGVILPIEVRAASPDTQTEIQYRRAAFAYVRRDFAEAERQIALLEAQSPNNFGVPVLRANIALARGRRAEAVAFFDRALLILQSGADVEYTRRVDAVRIQRTISGLAESRAGAAR
jgi:tetratricopeptide (TPR) repeat protein